MAKGSSNTLIGIDIGRALTKIIKAREEGSQLKIVDFSIKPTPQDKEEAAFTVKDIVEKMQEPKGEVYFYTAISGDKVTVRRVKVPSVPKEEISPLISSTISKVVGYPPEEVKFEYNILGEETEKGVKKLDVLFTVAKKNTWYEYLELFKKIGISPLAISPPAGNLSSFLEEGDGRSVMLVHIGYITTEITIASKAKVMFTRNIPFGIKDLADTLVDLKVPSDDAYKIIKEGDFRGSNLEDPSRIERAALSEIESLFKELHLTLSYYSKTTHKEEIERCIFSGGGAGSRLIKDALAKMWDVPIEEIKLPEGRAVLELFPPKDKEFNDNFYILAECLGCLLNKGKVGLLPVSAKVSRVSQFLAQPALRYGVAGFFAALLIFNYTVLAIRGRFYRKKVAELKRRWSTFDESVKKAEPLRQDLGRLKFKLGILKDLIKQHPSYSFALAKIFEAVPGKSVLLNELKLSGSGGKVKLELGGVSFDEQSHLRFMFDLENSGYYRKLSIKTQAKGGLSEELRSLIPADKISQALIFKIEGLLNTEKVSSPAGQES